jgi:hypothetical protein
LADVVTTTSHISHDVRYDKGNMPMADTNQVWFVPEAIDYVVVVGKNSRELADRLHEQFVNPAVISNGYYTTPTQPGYSIEMKKESYGEFGCPQGRFWKSEQTRSILEHPKNRLGGVFATSNGHSTGRNSLAE